MRDLFLTSLEKARVSYGFLIDAYAVMPEHVHLLVSEPPNVDLSRALQALKISVARRARISPFWTHRYHDFNVFTEKKVREKRRYIHRNPVERGLAAAPEDWQWSSYRNWLTGEKGAVEVESEWTAKQRWVADRA
jgi:putative transposase